MENKAQNQFWQLWMFLSLFSAILFPLTGIVAAVKMSGAKCGDYTSAKRWTILTYTLFAVSYIVILVVMTARFVQLLS